MLLDYDLNCFLEAPPIYSQWLLLLPSGHFFLTHYRMKLGPIWRGHWRLCLHLWLACLPIIEISNPRSSLISQMVTISLNSCWQLFWQWGSLNNLIFHLFDYNHCYMQTGTLTALSKAAPPPPFCICPYLQLLQVYQTSLGRHPLVCFLWHILFNCNNLLGITWICSGFLNKSKMMIILIWPLL